MATFPVIVADPPWDFTVWGANTGTGRGPQSHYDTMETALIQALPIEPLAAQDSVLLLWATWPNLLEALAVGEAWGFTYKTLGFIWVKRSGNGVAWHTGLGYWTRANSEPCLLFTRGNPKRVSKSVSQVIISDSDLQTLPGFEEMLTDRILSHSTKPESFYQRTQALLTGPYLELFGRRKRQGWTVLGNEIDGLDIHDSLASIKALELS